MANRPKSFWVERSEPLDPDHQWITYHDDLPVLALEAEIIHACSLKNLAPPIAEDMELWEIAAYLGLHRKETRADRDTREITEAKAEYFEETGEQRMEHLSGYSERRREQARERARQKREERANA